MYDYDLKNPYYHPEKMGLELIDSIDYGGGYDFDMCIVVLEKEANTLWYGFDTGCSCPTPFEGFTFEDGLTKLAPHDRDAWITFVESVDNLGYWYDDEPDDSKAQKTEFKSKAFKYLRELEKIVPKPVLQEETEVQFETIDGIDEVVMLMSSPGGWKVELWNCETLESMTLFEDESRSEVEEIQSFIIEAIEAYQRKIDR